MAGGFNRPRPASAGIGARLAGYVSGHGHEPDLLTEIDVGSDPARMSSTAAPTEDGTGYRINGTKLWATK